MPARKICRLPLCIVVILASQIDGGPTVPILHQVRRYCRIPVPHAPGSSDVLAIDGNELRRLPLSMRKASLERLLARRPEGIFVNPFERGKIGRDLFRAACNMGLEGLVSKHRDRPYQGGRSKH